MIKNLAIKRFAWNFLQHPSQKYSCNSTHIYNGKTWADIPSYVIFQCLKLAEGITSHKKKRIKANVVLLLFAKIFELKNCEVIDLKKYCQISISILGRILSTIFFSADI